jgi:hypothetical protein
LPARASRDRARGRFVGKAVYIKVRNHPKGQSFPRLDSDFGLADAIESGIVKIPRCHRMAGPQIFPPLGAHQGTPATG